MIAQLSHSEPFGSLSSSSIGVSCAGSLRTKSGSSFFPQTSSSSKSSPAARTQIRAVRVFTLGFRTLSVFEAISSSPGRRCLSVGVLRSSVVRERLARSRHERFDRIREVLARDVVVAALDANLVRLEQHLGVSETMRRLEPVRRQLDQQT